MNEQINQIVSQKIESVMYQIDYAHYQNFQQMVKYLDTAEAILDTKIETIDDRMATVQEEFIRTSKVLEMTNKKRQKEEELLKLERDRMEKDLQSHSERLTDFSVNPITAILKQKKKQLEKLQQAKDIIQQFDKLLKGSQDEIKNIMLLDSKNFSTSALKIYVFKLLLQDIPGQKYDNAKMQINKKYSELKSKIIQNFKQGFRNKDTKTIRATLPYCEEYQLMDQISEYYNEQIFKSVNKITQLDCQNKKSNEESADQSGDLVATLLSLSKGDNNRLQEESARIEQLRQGQKQIKNMFFLIEQSFHRAFSYKDEMSGEINHHQITNLMGAYSQSFGRKFITYAFDNIIHQSLENVLKSSLGKSHRKSGSSTTSAYLTYLQIFYDQCKKLVKDTQLIITDDRIIHLMSTYFQSIFDTYLDSYINKQINNLNQIYEYCTQDIMKDISDVAVTGVTQFAKDRQKNMALTQKKTIKQILYDFTLDSRKNIMTETNTGTQSINTAEPNAKIKNLLNVFSNQSINKLFSSTKSSLARNNKIAKINQIDKNRNQILQVFISNMEEIIQNLISLVSQIVPSFDERAPPMDPQFFQVIPNINLLLQRIEAMYEQYKRQNKYRLTESIKLDQKKQALILSCGKSLNKVVGEAMATILAGQSFIMNQQINQYYSTGSNYPQAGNDPTSKVIQYIQRYIRVIQRISLLNYRNNILKNLGLQFVNQMIRFYSHIPYNKEGLSKIFMDIAKYKTVVSQFGSQEVETKFKLLRSLIDIYVIKLDEKIIEDYVKTQNLVTRAEKQTIVEAYIKNKMRYEKRN